MGLGIDQLLLDIADYVAGYEVGMEAKEAVKTARYCILVRGAGRGGSERGEEGGAARP